jgi:hypothetical protein
VLTEINANDDWVIRETERFCSHIGDCRKREGKLTRLNWSAEDPKKESPLPRAMTLRQPNQNY